MKLLPVWTTRYFQFDKDNLRDFLTRHKVDLLGPNEGIRQALEEFQKNLGNDEMVLKLMTSLAKSNLTASGVAKLIERIDQDAELSSVSSEVGVSVPDVEPDIMADYYTLQPDQDQDHYGAIADLDQLESSTST